MAGVRGASSGFLLTRFVRVCLSEADARKLERFGCKVQDLAEGRVGPVTVAQARFVSVMNALKSPVSEWEFLWLRYRAIRNIEKRFDFSTDDLDGVDFIVRLVELLSKESKSDRGGSLIIWQSWRRLRVMRSLYITLV